MASEQSAKPSSPSRSGQTTVALALLLAAIYLFTGRFRLYTIDEAATFATTRSVTQHGTAQVDILAWALPISGANSVVATGVDGHVYSIKDIAPSLLLAPLFEIAASFGISAVRAVFIMPIIVTALTGALMARVVRGEGYRQPVAVAAGLIFGLGTLAFPYARSLFTQPLAALGLLIALWGVASARRTGRGWWALMGGLGLGLAGLSSAPVLATLPIYPLACVRRPPANEGGWMASVRGAARPVAMFATGAGILMGAQGVFNALRFGSPLATGHTQVGASLQPMYFGLGSWGQLVSAPRGVLWFVPLTVLIPFSLSIAARRGDPLALVRLCLAQCLIVWAVYSAYFYWWGGANFGPRFLEPVMPALTLLTVPTLDRVMRVGSPIWQRVLVGLIVLASLATQTMGSLADTSDIDTRIGKALDPITPPPGLFAYASALTDPRTLPQPMLWSALQSGKWDTLWMSSGQPDLPLMAMEGLLIALSAVWLVLALRDKRPRLLTGGLIFQSAALLALVAFAMARYPRAPGYYPVRNQPPDPGVEEAHRTLHDRARPGDGLIVLLYPEQMLTWLESPLAVPPDAGLTLENPLRPVNRALLARAAAEHPRLWVASRWSFPGDPANGVEQWLASHAYAGPEVRVENFRIIAYLTEAGSEPPHDRRDSFGDGAIRLMGASVSVRPAGLAVWLRWQATRAPDKNYTVFVHVLDAGGNLVAQQDGWPQGGYAPTSAWQPGQIIDDQRAVLLPDSLPAGQYTVQIGLYATEGGQPLLEDGSGDPFVLIGILWIK